MLASSCLLRICLASHLSATLLSISRMLRCRLLSTLRVLTQSRSLSWAIPHIFCTLQVRCLPVCRSVRGSSNFRDYGGSQRLYSDTSWT